MRLVLFLSFLTNLSLSIYGSAIDYDLFQMYSRALELKGETQYLKSQDLLKQIIEKDPNFARPYYQLVKIYKALDDLPSAETYFESLRKRNERNALVYFGLGVVREEEYKQGKRPTEESLVQYRRALELNAFDPMVYIRFGDMAQRLRQLDRAEDLAKRLVNEYPQNAAPHFGMAYIFQLRAKWNEALNHLQKALTLNPRMLNAYYTKGFGRA